MSRASKILLVVLFVLILGVIGGYVGLRLYEPKLRAHVLRAIEAQFDAKAELQSLQISLFPTAKIHGSGLKLWYKDRHDIPPLIQIDSFDASAGLRELFQKPKRIAEVNLTGLIIQIPPDQESDSKKQNVKTSPVRNKPKEARASDTEAPQIPPFVISRVRADGSVLRIIPKRADKEPLEFLLHRLVLSAVGADRPLQYHSTLKNATPPGLITAKGEFGPWNTSDPGQTPVSGEYNFRDADLSVFKGIKGTLSSKGQFQGVLKKIVVDGTTDIPDFVVKTGKQRVHLKTEFHAIVDGTKGDTYLQPVVANFERTSILCEGHVARRKGAKGKSVVLDVRVKDGRIEDILKFAVSGRPPVVGDIGFVAKMELPPGDVDVVRKLKLTGIFGVDDARFTTPTVQKKIEELSMKSRGKHDEEIDERIVSDLNGSFAIRNGAASFSRLSFMVPGARVQLEGGYNLETSEIDFEGTLRMDAKLSQTQKGIKSLLLKVVDPFFREGKTTVLPIQVTGTRENPKFGIRLGGGKNKKAK